MTIEIKHEFNCLIPDDPTAAAAGEIVISHWNANLKSSMATNKLVGRGTAGTGEFEEITLGTNLSLSGNTLNAAGGSGSPAGSNTWVQYNDSGSFGADIGFRYGSGTLVLGDATLGVNGQLRLYDNAVGGLGNLSLSDNTYTFINGNGDLAEGQFEAVGVTALPYGIGWSTSTGVPTRQDVYNKIQDMEAYIRRMAVAL